MNFDSPLTIRPAVEYQVFCVRHTLLDPYTIALCPLVVHFRPGSAKLWRRGDSERSTGSLPSRSALLEREFSNCFFFNGCLLW